MSTEEEPNTPTGGGNATPAPATTTTTRGQSQGNRNQSRNQPNRPVAVDTTSKSFNGEEPNVGAVLGLKIEKIDAKVTYDVFREKMCNYIGRKISDGDLIVCLVRDYTDPIKEFEADNKPKALTDDEADDPTEKAIHNEMVKLYVKQHALIRSNIKKVYALIWGQCSEPLQTLVRNNDEYKEKEKKKDVVWLLKQLKALTSGIDVLSNKRETLHDALVNFVTMRQGRSESLDDYMKRVKSNIELLVLAGGRHFLCCPEIMTKANKEPTDAEIATEEEKFTAMHILKRSDSDRYGDLLEELKNNSYFGRDDWPETSARAYEIMVRRSGNFPSVGAPVAGRGHFGGRGRGGRFGGRGVQFAQTTTRGQGNENNSAVPGRDGTTLEDIQCWNCHCWGHYSHNCTEERRNSRGGGGNSSGRQGAGFLQIRVGFAQGEDPVIPKSWLLLDTCSTASVGCNRALFVSLHPCPENDCLTVFTNGGQKTFDEIGDLKMLPLKMHFNEDSMANILCLKDVANIEGVQITMDSLKERAMLVHHKGQCYKFKECSEGLYYYDTNELPANAQPVLTAVEVENENDVKENQTDKSKDTVMDYSFLQTVESNKQYFTSAEIQGANNARSLQQMIGWPSASHFKSIVKKQLLQNCNVTVDDINRADIIYGPARPLLQGKMTRLHPPSTKIERIPLPLPIQEHHRCLQLFMDFFFVNGEPFLHTKTKKINFLTASHCTSRSQQQIMNVLESVIQKYNARGFEIEAFHGDNEFDIKALKSFLLPALINIYGKDEHVGFLERSVRLVKERCRCMCHALPYKYFTRLMVRALVACAIRWLNAFPMEDGISDTMSPSMIVEGKANPDLSHKRITFGSYAMVYIGTTNTMKRRSVPAIALNESNDRGGHYFMNLYTGKRLHSYAWEELPIDDDVIEQVEYLARQEKAPVMTDGYPQFEWMPGVPINDENVDTDETDDEREQLSVNDDEQINELHEDEDNENLEVDNDEEGIYITEDDNDSDLSSGNDDTTNEDEDNNISYDNDAEDANIDYEDEISDDIMNEGHDTSTDQNVLEPITGEPLDNDDQVQTEERIGNTEERTQRQSRTLSGPSVLEQLDMTLDRKTRTYTHNRERQFLMVREKTISPARVDYYDVALKVMFTQMSARKGLKLYGEEAFAAIVKEYRQMDEGPMPGKPVFEPVYAHDLTDQQKKQALESVNLMKEKRDGSLKARLCGDGSKQKQYLPPDESIYSPTSSTEGLLTSLVRDVVERRDVAVYDIPGAYLQTPVTKDRIIIMKLRGIYVDIMIKVNPEYAKYVVYENGVKVLYVRVLRALYGCIESAMLWYHFYAETLEGMGFEINPYDRCVANKMINGKQCTIVWYVDDNKVSHEDPNVVTEVLEEIKKYFGEITISRGKKHDFLGMNITLRDDGKFEIEMKNQIQEAIDKFGETFNYPVKTVCGSKLWEVNENSPRLDEKKSEIFHSVTAKLLYITKRARPDIETGVAFMTTRVSRSTEQDWKKLKRIITFLKYTIDDVRIIGAKGMDKIYTWVDAAFAVHGDMRSQTGGAMSFGYGMIHCKSSKQKLNTKSSTESELVGTSEYVPYNLWVLLFMTAQGYKPTKNVLFQDNMSTIKMLKNGRDSCTGNSRHIDIRHFFVKDRVDKKEIEVEHCPTELMIADYFTKPLQGSLFKLFRDLIMGYKHIEDILKEIAIAAKERVEKSQNVAVKSITSKNAHVRFAGEKIAHSARGAQGEKILRRTDTSYVNAVKYGQAARKTTFQLEPLRRKNAQKKPPTRK